MAKSFTITTTATDIVKASPAGHAEAVFTVTNNTARPVRGLARVTTLGDTKKEWLSISGESERDFAGGATEQFKVNFDATGGAVPAGKYPFRLDISSAQNTDEDFTDGPTVTVEVAAAPPPPPPSKPFPIWIIFVIIAVVLVIGGVILVVVLKSRGSEEVAATPTPTPVETPTTTPTAAPTATPVPSPVGTAQDAQRCYDLVQGHIDWDYAGHNGWSPINVQNLCRGTSNPSEPARCFDRVLHPGISYGSGTQWYWQNAINLCAGTNDADRTIACFKAKISAGQTWQQAIEACKSR
jgi:hypothetical protein